MYPHFDQDVLQSSVFVSDGRMRLFCIMSSVGFKSDFLVATAGGVMLRTRPSQIRGSGTHWGAVWYPLKFGTRKGSIIKIHREEKDKKQKTLEKLTKGHRKTGCSFVCDVQLGIVIKSHWFLYAPPAQLSVTAYVAHGAFVWIHLCFIGGGNMRTAAVTRCVRSSKLANLHITHTHTLTHTHTHTHTPRCF
jgi:hypothetical protein